MQGKSEKVIEEMREAELYELLQKKNIEERVGWSVFYMIWN